MSHVVPAGAVDTYLELAGSGQQQRAVRYIQDLRHDAIPLAALVTDLLAPAQREVGRRWHRGELSSADEHLITGVSQACLASMSSGRSWLDTSGLVLVACAEGDWHSLPAHMFAELLRDAGRGVLSLGPSTPAEDVASFIERHRPEALTVTCSLALGYVGTSRLVDVAHAHAVPVLAGGRALDAHRATQLGADGWASDHRAALRVLDEWRARRPAVDPDPVQLDPSALELDALAPTIAARAFPVLADRVPAVVAADRRRCARALEDLVSIVRSIAASCLVADPAVFDEFHSWLGDLYVARGLPEEALTTGIAALAPFVAEVDTQAGAVLAGT